MKLIFFIWFSSNQYYYEKKPLQIVLPYFGTVSLLTRNKLQKSIKGVLNCCKLQVILKVKIKSVTILVLETLFRKFLHQVWFISFSVDYAMNPGTCIRHLVVRSGEHIGILSLTNKRVQPRKDSAACHHLLNWN